MNVLFLTHRLPYAPNRGDRVRAFFLLKELVGRATVDVVSLVHDADEASHRGDLGSITGSVRIAMVGRARNLARSLVALPSDRPITHTMLDSPGLRPAIEAAVRERRPDVVLAYCSSMARCALEAPLVNVPFVLDMVDVDSAKWRDLAPVSRPPMSWIYSREARVLATFEAEAARRAVTTTVVTERERATLEDLAPDARIEVVGNGVDVAALRSAAPPSSSANVVFCGVMNYPPNEHAAVLLAREVWPLVRVRRSDATLTIVGSQPTPMVTSLADAASGITVTGAVPDVKPYLWNAAIAAAPIVTARGVQNKVLEAVAAGLPTVVTPNIVESLPDAVKPAVVSASGAPAIADAILRLLALSPAERRAIAAAADVDALTWERQLAPIEGLLRNAASAGTASSRPASN